MLTFITSIILILYPVIFFLFLSMYMYALSILTLGHLSTARAYVIRSWPAGQMLWDPGTRLGCTLPTAEIIIAGAVPSSLQLAGTRPVSGTACSTILAPLRTSADS